MYKSRKKGTIDSHWGHGKFPRGRGPCKKSKIFLEKRGRRERHSARRSTMRANLWVRLFFCLPSPRVFIKFPLGDRLCVRFRGHSCVQNIYYPVLWNFPHQRQDRHGITHSRKGWGGMHVFGRYRLEALIRERGMCCPVGLCRWLRFKLRPLGWVGRSKERVGKVLYQENHGAFYPKAT